VEDKEGVVEVLPRPGRARKSNIETSVRDGGH